MCISAETGGERHTRMARERRHSQKQRIEDLEIALRAALSFMQGRHTDPNDGHAQMVIAAMRGALRKPRD